jgi:hypothetical protein
MSKFRLSYPVTPESRAALARFPQIAKAVQIPATGRSELEVVRLLGNTHYDHVDRLLSFIESELPISDVIGARAVKQRDPFQFRESLAELFLFSHLRRRLGSGVWPTKGRSCDRRPEIEGTWRELRFRIEVYSPIDLMGFQLLTEHLRSLFKYLDVGRGFVVALSIDPVEDSVDKVWYPYTFPPRQDMLAWLQGVGQQAHAFLARSVVLPGDHFQLPGPGGTTTVLVKVREVFVDPGVRGVEFTTGTHSTDARLLFECGTPEDTARSGWGRKLKEKMRQRQAGLPAPHLLRMLVLNFAQANTGWPEFFGWPGIARRIYDAVKLIAGELTASLPYDVVLPARLDLDCCFGHPVWLNCSIGALEVPFIEAACLGRPCALPPAPAQDTNLEELVELGLDGAREESAEISPPRGEDPGDGL